MESARGVAISGRVFTPTYCYPADSLAREDGTDTLSPNVGKQLPHDAA
jgi:hypothetical protein